MDGIQYLINENGEKKAVVIDLEKWGDLWLKIYSQIENKIEDNQQNWLNDPIVQNDLDQALEWNYNNPPQVSNLDEIATKLNIYE
ncbi:MAG: hypothetical protein GW856_02915 [Cyanobacteria bacterium]|nr:hypothetical protein [Cyanobacteria bacterium CG_2015-16_32_12]NCO78304.1 hypothetical protein [Cyanobacteria bacterium CG_2015-22_32_23]NCS84522.1 hypothetical protein [Cyanobacteria bacterium CG_2015-02_32_10]